MKSLYKRQLFMMVFIMLLSFTLLSAAFMLLSYRYMIQDKRDDTARNAGYISNFTTNYVQQNIGIRDDFYRNYIQGISDTHYWPGQKPEPELPEALCSQVRACTDTAVISISRFSGEGWDRDLKGHPMYEEGDFYLSYAERAMVQQVKKYFPKIVVVMNVGGMVDTEWFCHDDKIQGVLMAWQGGMEGGMAAAELLCGIGNPSGKLSDTFAKRLEDYPSTENFHESDDYVDYTEDIYVGYRYFETIPGAEEKVNYPFGFGLSYTKFEQSVQSIEQKNGRSTSVILSRRPFRTLLRIWLVSH